MINEDLYYVKGKGIDSNSYLLEAKDHFILIDTGTGIKLGRIPENARRHMREKTGETRDKHTLPL